MVTPRPFSEITLASPAAVPPTMLAGAPHLHVHALAAVAEHGLLREHVAADHVVVGIRPTDFALRSSRTVGEDIPLRRRRASNGIVVGMRNPDSVGEVSGGAPLTVSADEVPWRRFP